MAAAGLARYGVRREAGIVLHGLIDATEYLPHRRLPELFGGFARRRHGAEPVRDDITCQPIPEAPAVTLRDVVYWGRSLTLTNTSPAV